jgi:hypothetical protein
MILMGARPYDPTLGRFLAVDPIDGGSLNNYDYAGQDPINGYDLDGMMTRGESPECPHGSFAIIGYCAQINELAITSYRALAIRAVQLITSRMSRATAERVTARLEGPITRAANRLGYSARVAVHNAHHYFSRVRSKSRAHPDQYLEGRAKGKRKGRPFRHRYFLMTADSFESLEFPDEGRISLGYVSDLYELLRAVDETMPKTAILYLEGASIAPDVRAFLESRQAAGPHEVAHGTVYPTPMSFHLPLSDQNLVELRGLADHHAEPEICDHLAVYQAGELLLTAYDAGYGEVIVAKSLPHDTIQALRLALGND